MATIKKVCDGLVILLKYAPEGECFASHDHIGCGPGKEVEISPADLSALDAFGWAFDEDEDYWYCFT